MTAYPSHPSFTPIQNVTAGRRIAIGDIHGEVDSLTALLSKLDIQKNDVLVVLGDCINRGPRSNEVLECLIELSSRSKLIGVLGNHEEVFLETLRRPEAIDQFLSMGGGATLASYGHLAYPDEIPGKHIEFIKSFVPFWENETEIFIHANYCWYMPMDQQPAMLLRWTAIEDSPPKEHISGKRVVCGHSPGQVRDLGFCLCIDTGSGFGGPLCAAVFEENSEVHFVSSR